MMWSHWKISSVISTHTMLKMWWVLNFFVYILQTDACAFIVTEKPMAGMNPKSILVPQRNKFVFQLVPTGTPIKVPTLRGYRGDADASRRKCRLSFLRHWSGLKQNIWHVMFSLFCCLSVWLPVCLSVSTLTVTPRAKLESSCQSKTIFLWEYCSLYNHVNEALYIFN